MSRRRIAIVLLALFLFVFAFSLSVNLHKANAGLCPCVCAIVNGVPWYGQPEGIHCIATISCPQCWNP